MSGIEDICRRHGVRMTSQRRTVARVLSESDDHPDVSTIHERALRYAPDISQATVYRSVRLFEKTGLLNRHDFGDGRARFEVALHDHHDHFVNIRTGTVREFKSEKIEKLQRKIAEANGYRLVGHRLELYVVPREGGNT